MRSLHRYVKWRRLSRTGAERGSGGYSTLLACAGVGATLSALWLAHGGPRRSLPVIIMWAFLGFLIALASLFQTGSIVSAGLAMIALGGFFEICRTGTVALLQTSVLDELRGRLMSTQFLLMRFAGALGVWGLRMPLQSCALFALIVWSAVFRLRSQILSAFAAPDT